MYDWVLLPVREDIVTGESELAMPAIMRDMVRGFLISLNREKVGVQTGRPVRDDLIPKVFLRWATLIADSQPRRYWLRMLGSNQRPTD